MILHISTSLDNGGAEALLVSLVKADEQEEHVVVSLSHLGFYGEELQESGITVHALNMPRSRITPGALLKLFRLIRQYDPRVIQCWMYHANFLTGIIARLAGKNRIVWGLHNSIMDPAGSSFSVRVCDKLCALMSGFVPRRIVHSSVSGAEIHIEKGYKRTKMEVIPSGYNLDRYRPDAQVGTDKRESLGLPTDLVVVGMIARFNPQKDHGNMMRAIGLMPEAQRQRCRFVFVGDAIDADNQQLAEMIDTAGIRDVVTLLGPRRDVPELMNMLDLHVLSSAFGESFPNVVNEAMACGVPCIVTDSGDSAMIVDDTGWVVPTRDAQALADTLVASTEQVGTDAWQQRKLACRQRVLDNFTLEKMIAHYHRIWSSVSPA